MSDQSRALRRIPRRGTKIDSSVQGVQPGPSSNSSYETGSRTNLCTVFALRLSLLAKASRCTLCPRACATRLRAWTINSGMAEGTATIRPTHIRSLTFVHLLFLSPYIKTVGLICLRSFMTHRI